MNDIHMQDFEADYDINFVKSKQKSYLLLRFLWTGIICSLNVAKIYVIPRIDTLHYFWLFLCVFSFSNILYEICIFYWVNAEVPDQDGMITRHPQKQESFIQIPGANQGEADDKPLMFSFDESVDNLFKSFKEKKVRVVIQILSCFPTISDYSKSHHL